MLAERAHLPFASFFDLGDLLLQGVEVLLHRSQGGQHLALLLQFAFLFIPPAFRLLGRAFALPLNAHPLCLLSLRKLRFHIGQLLGETFVLSPASGQ